MDTFITTEFGDPGPLLRLMQLISPSLPVGEFTYSQGLECGWVTSPEAFARWQQRLIDDQLSCLDWPLLKGCICARANRTMLASPGGRQWRSVVVKPAN